MYNKDELLKIDDDYLRALELVNILFKDIKDKEGQPYIGHLIRVSEKLENKNTKVAGLLHDTIEDISGITFNHLRGLKFNEEILELIRLVTKKQSKEKLSKEEKKLKYHREIMNIINSGNIEAVKLKYADMSDNFNEERMTLLDEQTRIRLKEKYQEEIKYLENYLKERGEII